MLFFSPTCYFIRMRQTSYTALLKKNEKKLARSFNSVSTLLSIFLEDHNLLEDRVVSPKRLHCTHTNIEANKDIYLIYYWLGVNNSIWLYS
jgi:hypothetical protein